MFKKIKEVFAALKPSSLPFHVHVDRGSGSHCVAGPYSTKSEAEDHRVRLASQDHPESKYSVHQH